MVFKLQIAPKIKAWTGEKAQHTQEYVSILGEVHNAEIYAPMVDSVLDGV